MSRARLPTSTAAPAAALLTVVALAVLVFFDLVFRGRVLFERDIHVLLWGQWTAFGAVVRGGAWPVWNPFLGFGQPLLANPGAQVFYPPTWLNLALRPETYVDLYSVSHLVVAGAGMLWLGRTLRLSWGAATAAAATWMLSGPVLSAVDLWQHFAGAAWAPWVVAGAARALARPAPGPVLAWALLQSGQVLTGSMDLVALTALPQMGLLVTHLSWRRPLAGQNGRVVAAGAVAAALTVVWTAALWLPAADLLGRTARAEQPPWERMKWSAPPLELTQTLLPLFPQDLPLRDDVRQRLYGTQEPLLTSLYLGLPALALALAGLASRRRRLAAAAGGLVALSLLLSLGRFGLVYFWVLEMVPSLGLLRYPVKATLFAAFGFALLAGLGVEALRGSALSRRTTLSLAAAGGALGGLALLAAGWARAAHEGLLAPSKDYPLIPGAVDAVLAVATWSGSAALVTAGLVVLASRATPSRRGALVAALAGLAVLDLLVAHRGLNPTVERSFVRTTPEAVELLRADGARRVYAFDYIMNLAGQDSLRPELPPALARLPPMGRQLVQSQVYPVSTPRWGLRGSFDLDVVGLDSPPRRGLRLLAIAVERRPDQLLRLLRVGGVGHVVALHREGLELLEPLATVNHPALGPIHLLRVPGAAPAVSAVGGTRVARGRSAYETLLDPSFDPRATLLLREGEPREAPSDLRWETDLVSERADRLHVRASASAPAFLLVPDGYDTGWRARVDGRPAPVLRANLAFRAVPLPAGAHEIEMTYHTPGLARGLTISGLSLAAALLFAGVWSRRRYDTRREAP